MTRRISVRAIITHNNNILCVQLKPYNEVSAVMEDKWCLPGGTLEEGESLTYGLEREIIEETGIKPVIGNLLYIQQFAFSGKEHLEFFFHVTNGEDFTDVDLAATSHGADEIQAIDFIDPATTALLPEFLMTDPIFELIAANAPPKIFSYL